jgi:hypothetical protein
MIVRQLETDRDLFIALQNGAFKRRELVVLN